MLGLATVLLVVCGQLGGAVAASADPSGPQDMSNVNWTLPPYGTSSAGTAYSNMLASLRSAAGHIFRDDVEETATDPQGLVALNVTSARGNVTFYYTAADLYLRGYQAGGNLTQFTDYNLQRRLNHQGSVWTFPHDGSYPALVRDAGVNRTALTISTQSLNSAMVDLASNDTLPAARANALLRIIAATSEAARFNGIEVIHAVALNNASYSTHLTDEAVAFENNWGTLSNFAHNITNDPTTPPVTVFGNLFTNWADVQRSVALIQSSHLPPTS
ncbi:ribosome-inactivating family protein [Streptomyces sp. NPDC094438]|uniref:ribosome-inactivating family protein n=1 Tax=Streptomyces sp. NPDC094438 TaxID=3366061 RepID=UPI00380111A3